jgi:hypothetical protein
VNFSLYSPVNKSITAAYSSNYIKDEQKCINKNKRICSVKFGFSPKAALKDLEGRRFPTLGVRPEMKLRQIHEKHPSHYNRYKIVNCSFHIH